MDTTPSNANIKKKAHQEKISCESAAAAERRVVEAERKVWDSFTFPPTVEEKLSDSLFVRDQTES